MKKIALILASLMLLGAFTACDLIEGLGTTTRPTDDEPRLVERELLFDRTFSEGIKISNLNSHQVGYTWWKYGEAGADEPFWSLGQYCDLSATRSGYDSTKNDLSLGNELFDIPAYGITGTDGEYFTLTNSSGSKYISVNTQTGEYNLNIDTTKEYVDQTTGETAIRSNGEDWVHMIIQQTPGVVYLDEVEGFIMELDFTITENVEYDNSIGASQFQWIFTVHDKASTLGDYMWFNVTLFDNRYEVFPGTQIYDGGKADATGKFIYAPTGKELFPESGGKVEIGKTYHVRLDLKEYMRAAFELAKSRGALSESKWEDMAVNGFNIGWEVSNLARVGVKIENMSLRVIEYEK